MKRNVFYFLWGILLIVSFIFVSCSSTPAQPVEWDRDSLDTARNVDFLSEDLQNLVFELNKMRTDPKKYAVHQRRIISRSLYRFLMRMEPLPPFVPAEGLCRLASNVFDTRSGIDIPSRTALNLAIAGSLVSGEYGNSGRAHAAIYNGYQRRYSLDGEVVVRADIIRYLKYLKEYKSPENTLFSDCTYFGVAQSIYDRVANNITIIVVSENYSPR